MPILAGFPRRVLGAALLGLCNLAAAPDGPPGAAARQALAPNGRLRAAINFGNPVLAQPGAAGAPPRGVATALARALAGQLGVPVDFVLFHEAGQVSAAAGLGRWDVAFLAIDPLRARSIGFTPPYVTIDGTYLVPAASPLRQTADIDRPGLRVAVAAGSAYDLFLTRTLRQAQLLRAADNARARNLLLAGAAEALAGIGPPLRAWAEKNPGWRVLPGSFMQINQAMAVPVQNQVGLAYLRGFIAAMLQAGFVAAALRDSGQDPALAASPQEN